MGLLPVNDGGPGGIHCLLISQRSSLMMMGGHQLHQSTVGTCVTPGKDVSRTHVRK